MLLILEGGNEKTSEIARTIGGRQTRSRGRGYSVMTSPFWRVIM
jgi:hypothetical protein